MSTSYAYTNSPILLVQRPTTFRFNRSPTHPLSEFRMRLQRNMVSIQLLSELLAVSNRLSSARWLFNLRHQHRTHKNTSTMRWYLRCHYERQRTTSTRRHWRWLRNWRRMRKRLCINGSNWSIATKNATTSLNLGLEVDNVRETSRNRLTGAKNWFRPWVTRWRTMYVPQWAPWQFDIVPRSNNKW